MHHNNIYFYLTVHSIHCYELIISLEIASLDSVAH